jgi:hypothetical protein
MGKAGGAYAASSWRFVLIACVLAWMRAIVEGRVGESSPAAPPALPAPVPGGRAVPRHLQASASPLLSSSPLPSGLASTWCPRYSQTNGSLGFGGCTADDYVPVGNTYGCGSASPNNCQTYSSFTSGCSYVWNPWGGSWVLVGFNLMDRPFGFQFGDLWWPY